MTTATQAVPAYFAQMEPGSTQDCPLCGIDVIVLEPVKKSTDLFCDICAKYSGQDCLTG